MTGSTMQQTPGQEGHIFAPWSPEQVEALNLYQKSGAFHPFTSEHSGADLIATVDGWVETQGGPVVQDWAHAFMADKERIQQRMDFMNGRINPPQE